MEQTITIVEVGPRDGLQNEKQIVPTDIKIEFIKRLLASGLKTIETTSFVSPKWVPQMGDHEQLVNLLTKVAGNFVVLVPNMHGLEKVLNYPVKQIAVFAAASETFSQKNINRSIAQSLEEYKAVIQTAHSAGLLVRGYVSCALGCPYEGKIETQAVVNVARQLYQAGCYQISLGDTIGVGTALSAQKLVKELLQEIPAAALALHFHDTYGQALANILACLELGIHTIDSAAAGLGGCPYAKGATGNVASEDVIYMLHGLGLKTGVDIDKLISAGEYMCQYLNRPNCSKVAIATLAKKT
ncbi:MAG: hydroxymethylglutaryl-CoA lyase [Proteobacteria bacterium]|nr:hydroxymethylglutaryl-CoA lyase [Pseudomonadota bacterium]